MTSCSDFLIRLEGALATSGEAPRLTELSWHQHLATCAACRNLLAAEEALELLLDSLPDPTLPPALAARVLLRLRTHRNDEALERLLALDDHIGAPADLSQHVLRGLASSRRPVGSAGQAGSGGSDEDLDRALEAVPAPVVPAGLADRVLARLDPERRREERFVARFERLVAAALVIAGLGTAFWILRGPAPNDAGGPNVEIVHADPVEEDTDKSELEPSTEMLANLYVLENWDLVQSEDLHVQLAAEVQSDSEFLPAEWVAEETR